MRAVRIQRVLKKVKEKVKKKSSRVFPANERRNGDAWKMVRAVRCS